MIFPSIFAYQVTLKPHLCMIINKEDSDWMKEHMGDLPEESDCPIANGVLAMLSLNSKLFGIEWSDEEMTDFLKKAGYKIINREDELVVIDPECSSIPERSNLKKYFEKEIKKIILDYLIKLKHDE